MPSHDIFFFLFFVFPLSQLMVYYTHSFTTCLFGGRGRDHAMLAHKKKKCFFLFKGACKSIRYRLSCCLTLESADPVSSLLGLLREDTREPGKFSLANVSSLHPLPMNDLCLHGGSWLQSPQSHLLPLFFLGGGRQSHFVPSEAPAEAGQWLLLRGLTTSQEVSPAYLGLHLNHLSVFPPFF